MTTSSPQIHHSDDTKPGYARKKNGKAFIYLDQRGRPLRNERIVKRLKSLAMPPAYHDVWYCPDPRGHIQAAGRDARGRKQYRYHAGWTASRDAHKYHRMLDFAKALPKIRKTTARHLRLPNLPKEKVLATVVTLLEKTLIRVGNEEYAKTNDSFGLTTLRDSHAQIRGAHVRFRFKGKSHVMHDLELNDLRLAKIIKQCRDLPGHELFQYVNKTGKVVDIKSDDVNQYLKAIAGDGFSAKDFRTWAGTLLAAKALQEYKNFSSQSDAKKKILMAIESVAKKLGNTKAICRKCYIHPEIINAFMEGEAILATEAALLVLLEKRLNTKT